MSKHGRWSVSITALLTILALGLASDAAAQGPIVINAPNFRFGPSPDHDAVFEGQVVVTGYRMEMATVASPTVVVQTYELNKPTPASGVISVPTAFGNLPAGVYIGRVWAYGPGGNSPKLQATNQVLVLSAPQAPTGEAAFH